MRSIIKYFQKVLLELSRVRKLFSLSCDQSSSTFSKSDRQRNPKKPRKPSEVRSIIKYFQQVLHILKRKAPRLLKMCDQSSSTFSRSYVDKGKGLYLFSRCNQSSSTFSRSYDNRKGGVRHVQTVRSIIKYFQQALLGYIIIQ